MNVGYAYTTLAPGLIGNTIPPDVSSVRASEPIGEKSSYASAAL